MDFEKKPNPSRPAPLWLGGPELYATSSPCVILLVNTPGFEHNEDMYGFGPYDAFLSSDVPEMVNQQNSWNPWILTYRKM
jgi:hypothetical protein